MVNDPIADLLTRIRNAGRAGQRRVSLPRSRLKEAVLKTLKTSGFIKDYQVKDGQLMVSLKYTPDGEPAIENLKRISKPGRRVYRSVDKLPFVRNGYGIAIISTSRGVMTDREARKENLGGEVLAEVW
jgi:small subunit ribosomal protein S8